MKTPDQTRTTEESGLAWYAAYAKHHHEKKAAELLTKKNFSVLLPLYRTVNQWKDRKKEVFLPVFPCYLFVLTNPIRRLEVLRTAGIFSIVSSGGEACIVPERDMELVRRIASAPDAIQPHPYLSAGQFVRVRSGPFAGQRGVLTRVKNQFRVVMSVELLQKSVALELDVASLELSDDSHDAAAHATEICRAGS